MKYSFRILFLISKTGYNVLISKMGYNVLIRVVERVTKGVNSGS